MYVWVGGVLGSVIWAGLGEGCSLGGIGGMGCGWMGGLGAVLWVRCMVCSVPSRIYPVSFMVESRRFHSGREMRGVERSKIAVLCRRFPALLLLLLETCPI